MNFARVCTLLSAKRCYAAGMPVRLIAQQAGRSITTVRRWIKT